MNVLTFIRTRLEHLRNQKRSRAALQAKNIQKFRRLVAYARQHSPYYAEVIRRHDIDVENCRPEDFPVLTKRELMENFDRIVTDPSITKQKVEDFLAVSRDPSERLDDRFHVIHTSGSSGEIGLFVYSSKDWSRGIAHALRLNGFALRRRKMAYFAATRGHFAGVSFLSTAQRSINKLFFNVETYDVNSPIHTAVDGLNEFQPEVLIGYASSLKVLAEKQKQGVLKISPSVIQTSGEALNSSDRSFIEDVFGQPLLNVYMSSEHIYMGMSRPHEDGMILLEDDLIFEINEDHTCITNLFNYTMPLFRYRMEDVLVSQPERESDGPYTRVRNIVGRNEHTPVFANKYGTDDFISPHIINEFIVKDLRRFQLQLVGRESFIFKACLEPTLDGSRRREVVAEIQAGLRRILAEKNMENVSFQVRVVSDLPVDAKTGKFRLILPRENRPGAKVRPTPVA